MASVGTGSTGLDAGMDSSSILSNQNSDAGWIADQSTGGIPAQTEMGWSSPIADAPSSNKSGNKKISGDRLEREGLHTGYEKVTPPELSEEETFKPRPIRTAPAIRMARLHFADEVLSELREIRAAARTHLAAAPVNRFMYTVRTMSEISPSDPFLHVVLGLNDAIAFDNRWIEFTSDQYKGAYEILEKAASDRRLDQARVEKSLASLEKLGFNTTDFGVEFGDDPEEPETNAAGE